MVTQEERDVLKQELLKEIREEQKQHEEAVRKAKAAAKRKAKQIKKAEEEARKEEEERLKASEEPWIDIKGEEDPKNKGVIKVAIDWNEAFIKLLRENGYRGVDDEAIIQHYLAVIAKRASDDLGADQISEYE